MPREGGDETRLGSPEPSFDGRKDPPRVFRAAESDQADLRELRVSRKVIRSEATAFQYTRAVQPAPKFGSWRDEHDRMLPANAGKARRERLTLMRIYEALRGLGYEGGYDAVRRYAKGWKRERTAVTA